MTVIGVTPGAELDRRRRLFDALEAAYGVTFAAGDAGESGAIDGLITFGVGDDRARSGARVPGVAMYGAETPPRPAQPVAFADTCGLARPLRGASLSEAHGSELVALPIVEGSVVLATVDGVPAWVLESTDEGRRHHVALAPAELGPGEALRNRLAPGRCLALLPLVQLCIDLTATCRWEPPGPRAAFVIDDPNLRRPSYGHIDYRELAKSSASHGYHVSMATVPLDARRVPTDGEAVRLFREARPQLSLCIHGNDHRGPELGLPRSPTDGLAVAAQALRRVRAFERRTGVPVDRVMVAPHERISEGALAALLACGYEAFCGARPYPWIATSPDLAWLTRPEGSSALIGWGSAELMPGGFPLLMRMDFGHPREEIVIRALLGQPIILYGHHDLLEHGPAVLEATAAQVNRVGDVRWSSLAGIARGAVESRRTDAMLELRMLGRHVSFDVPAGVSEVRVDTSALAPARAAAVVAAGPIAARDESTAGDQIRLAVDRAGRIECRLADGLDPAAVPTPPRRLAPIARRMVTEWRDRARPVMASRRS